MGKAFEGELNNMEEQYNHYDTYCMDALQLELLGRVFEGCRIKIQVLDDEPLVKKPLDQLKLDVDKDIQKFIDSAPIYSKDTDNRIGNGAIGGTDFDILL